MRKNILIRVVLVFLMLFGWVSLAKGIIDDGEIGLVYQTKGICQAVEVPSVMLELVTVSEEWVSVDTYMILSKWNKEKWKNDVFAVKCAGCPPNDYDDWHRLVNCTVKALVARYGLDEVSSWNFEPRLDSLIEAPCFSALVCRATSMPSPELLIKLTDLRSMTT